MSSLLLPYPCAMTAAPFGFAGSINIAGTFPHAPLMSCLDIFMLLPCYFLNFILSILLYKIEKFHIFYPGFLRG
jgi:hypothetical protein